MRSLFSRLLVDLDESAESGECPEHQPPSVTNVSTITIPQNEWQEIYIEERQVGKKRKRQKLTMRPGWTEVFDRATQSTCRLRFLNHELTRSSLCVQARCSILGCPCKFNYCGEIPKEEDCQMSLIIQGIPNHSPSRSCLRPTERRALGKKIQKTSAIEFR